MVATSLLNGADQIWVDFTIASMSAQALSPYGLLHDYWMGTRQGQIIWLEPQPAVLPLASGATWISGERRLLTPGLIDCHTHCVFGGSRADEWERRLLGESYQSIAAAGGGILSTVRATRAASEDSLFETAKTRLEALIADGVTTVEIKSGYGLNLETELKMLRVANRLGTELGIHVIPTLLAAHTLPQEYQLRAEEYVAWVCKEMIPAAKDLCHAVDVFCESIAFTVEQSQRVLHAALDYGLRVKAHAEQLSYQGFARIAAEMGALSVDHIEFLPESECTILKANETVATLLPGAFYFLREVQRPPVKALIHTGVSIAVATDCNPGSSPLLSLRTAGNMACVFFGLSPEQSLAGMTRNAAKALGIDDHYGTIEVGKNADFAIWDVASPVEIIYSIGSGVCHCVVKGGKIIHKRVSGVCPLEFEA
jgi:imidazolonepropionase